MVLFLSRTNASRPSSSTWGQKQNMLVSFLPQPASLSTTTTASRNSHPPIAIWQISRPRLLWRRPSPAGVPYLDQSLGPDHVLARPPPRLEGRSPERQSTQPTTRSATPRRSRAGAASTPCLQVRADGVMASVIPARRAANRVRLRALSTATRWSKFAPGFVMRVGWR